MVRLPLETDGLLRTHSLFYKQPCNITCDDPCPEDWDREETNSIPLSLVDRLADLHIERVNLVTIYNTIKMERHRTDILYNAIKKLAIAVSECMGEHNLPFVESLNQCYGDVQEEMTELCGSGFQYSSIYSMEELLMNYC